MITTALLVQAFQHQGLSREDASNRLRKLVKAGVIQEVGRIGRRELYYEITEIGKKRARKLGIK